MARKGGSGSRERAPRKESAAPAGERSPPGDGATPPVPARAGSGPPFVPTPIERPDALVAAGIAALALALYAVTACRTMYVGDSAELAMAAAVFGIPHPPGYPLFTVVTGLLSHLVPVADRALAANLVAALYAAVAVLLASLLGRRLGSSRPSAAFGAVSLAAGTTFWAQGTAIEVYGFDAMLALLAAHAALSAHRSPRALALAVLAGSVWIGHRPLNLVYAPALVLLGTATGVELRAVLRQPRLLVPALAGALPFVWLPLRSLADPALDVGDPETLDRFLTVVRSAPYVRHWMAGSLELGLARVAAHVGVLPRELGIAALCAIAALAPWPAPPRRRLVIALGWVVAVNLVIVTGYHVLDIEAYFLPSSWALALLGALGLDVAFERLGVPGLARWAPLAAALALVPWNFPERDLSEHRLARWAAEDVLAAAPPRALVLVDGDTSIHGAWYLQGVVGLRPDVIVFSPGHVSDWYVDELARRHPDEPWPRPADGRLDPTRYTRAVLRAFDGHRPLFAIPSVSLERYGAGGASGDPLGPMPHGVGNLLLPVGESVEIAELAAFSREYFDTTMARVLPVPRLVDVDSASLYLLYALSMSRTADLVARRHPDLAEDLYARIIAIRADEHDRAVRDDVLRGLGEEIPALGLEGHAGGSLAELVGREHEEDEED